MIKKSFLNKSIIVYVSTLLIIGLSYQVSINLFENNSSFSLNSGLKFVYAQDNNDGNGGGDGDGNGGGDGDGDGNGGGDGDGGGNGGGDGDGNGDGDGDGNGGGDDGDDG